MWMQARVEQEGTGGLALVGDSIMETVNWTSLGMHRTVNMGFGGARTRNILQRIEKPLKTVKPDAAILMASINNAVKGLPEDEVKAYEAEYFVLVRKLKAATPKVALMTVMPVEAGKSNSPFYDGFYVPILNKVIR
jgi:hypothetical protein